MKTDARVRYTKMRLREAFLACLREKPVGRITVKELCEMAEINRATFYTHYQDPFDLLEKLEEETLEELRATISENKPDDEALPVSLLQGLKGEDSTARLLGSENGDPNFGAKVSAFFYEALLPRMEERLPGLDGQKRRAVYRFLAGGCANMIADWVGGGMQTPPEALARQMREFSEAVVSAAQNDARRASAREQGGNS